MSILFFIILSTITSCVYSIPPFIWQGQRFIRQIETIYRHTSVFPNAYYSINSIENYGNWCGAGHGGYDDCCNGKACSSCGRGPRRGDWNFQLNLNCLKECPPIDEIDLSCAQHDTCCGVYGSQCPSLFPSEHCFCNGILAKNVCHFDPYNKVCLVFNKYDYALSCWACGLNRAPNLCLRENYVYDYSPNLEVSLNMLREFFKTGVTNFLSISTKLSQNCTAQSS